MRTTRIDWHSFEGGYDASDPYDRPRTSDVGRVRGLRENRLSLRGVTPVSLVCRCLRWVGSISLFIRSRPVGNISHFSCPLAPVRWLCSRRNRYSRRRGLLNSRRVGDLLSSMPFLVDHMLPRARVRVEVPQTRRMIRILRGLVDPSLRPCRCIILICSIFHIGFAYFYQTLYVLSITSVFYFYFVCLCCMPFLRKKGHFSSRLLKVFSFLEVYRLTLKRKNA